MLTKKNVNKMMLKRIKNFTFKIKILHKLFVSNTIKINLTNLQTFIYNLLIVKSTQNIHKNEIIYIANLCKLNNVLEFDNVLNKILKSFRAKLMFLFLSLF